MDKDLKKIKKIVIEIDDNYTVQQELFEYICDCWIEFIVGDLGCKPSDMIMIGLNR